MALMRARFSWGLAVLATTSVAPRARADAPDAGASSAAPSEVQPTAPAATAPPATTSEPATLPPPPPPPLTVSPSGAVTSEPAKPAPSGDASTHLAVASATERPHDRDALRPHTIAEIEAGIIALPNAPISPSQRGGNTPIGGIGKGDATLMTGLHLLYRGAPEWAVGAGFLFGPSPTTDTQYGGLGNLPRTHARNYLLVGAEGRYVPFATRKLEAWVGMNLGGVIIADRFTTETGDKVPTILGTRDVTIRTEGYALGVQAGGSWMFAERWVLGLSLRGDRWFLPSSAQCSTIGDCATLTGSVVAFETGLTIGYRIPL